MLWFISFVAICKERRQLHVKILFRSAGKELLKYQLPYHRFHKGLFKGCCVFPCMRLFIRVERICLTEEVQRIYKKTGTESFYGLLQSSTWKVYHYTHYFIFKDLCCFKHYAKTQTNLAKERSKETEKPQITQLKKIIP